MASTARVAAGVRRARRDGWAAGVGTAVGFAWRAARVGAAFGFAWHAARVGTAVGFAWHAARVGTAGYARRARCAGPVGATRRSAPRDASARMDR
jgi:hypothetical protein